MAKAQEHVEEQIYHEYMAETARAVSHNTGSLAGGMEMTKSLREVKEMLREGSSSEAEVRTADEVIEHMKNKLGNIGGKEG